MTTRDNIIYYTITAIVFVGVVVCSILFHNSEQPSKGGATNEEKQSRIAKFNEFAPIIEALSVSGSFVFVIWVTCFRKTRRDRVDDIKFEVGILLSEKENLRMTPGEIRVLFDSLPQRF